MAILELLPCTARVSQDYGVFPQASGQPWIHTGIDFAGDRGQEVFTIADGKVLFAGPGRNVPNDLADLLMLYRGSDASGNCVIVEHEGWVETFNHLEFYTVNTGDTVKRGFRVGGMGDSGNAFGVHLHYETLTIPAVNTPPFSRYNPWNQIAHENLIAAKEQIPSINLLGEIIMSMTPDQASEALGYLREIRDAAKGIHHEITPGIAGKKHAGDFLVVLTDIRNLLSPGISNVKHDGAVYRKLAEILAKVK